MSKFHIGQRVRALGPVPGRDPDTAPDKGWLGTVVGFVADLDCGIAVNFDDDRQGATLPWPCHPDELEPLEEGVPGEGEV